MPPVFTCHVKTTDRGVLLREHETIDQANADADQANAEAEKLGVKARYIAVEGLFPKKK